MAKIYQIATVLYDVLRTVVPSTKVDAEVWFMFPLLLKFQIIVLPCGKFCLFI